MPKYLPIKMFGFEAPAPRWALTIFALVLLTGATWTVYQKVYADPERALLSLKDANKQLAAEVEEYSLHAMEEPEKHELFEEQDGRLALRVFKDHCVLIQRATRRGVRTKLVIDLDRGAALPMARWQVPAPHHALNVLPVVAAADQRDACRGGCLNPHGGQFRWWYGARQGDWVEVWRQWPEGCTHVQMFNPIAGLWDSNPDSTPRVRWTCCVH
jgi:hypothetical protein